MADTKSATTEPSTEVFDECLFSIVVIGFMNPSIHSPAWYRFAELIDDAEMGLAYSSSETFATPALSQFQVGGITVICQPNRWEAKATSPDSMERLMQLPIRVFDELLEHTPVMSLGLNFHFRRMTNADSVGALISRRLKELGFGLAYDHLESGFFALNRRFEDRTSSLTVKPGNPKSCVVVVTNYNYPLEPDEPGEGTRTIHLGRYIAERFRDDFDDAVTQTDTLVKTLNDMKED